jgi:predicted kinase
MDASQRPIVLLAGAAGIGKTRAAAALAQHLRAQIVRTDDLATAARAMTDPPNNSPRCISGRLTPKQSAGLPNGS